jgi:hypothetical protein
MVREVYSSCQGHSRRRLMMLDVVPYMISCGRVQLHHKSQVTSDNFPEESEACTLHQHELLARTMWTHSRMRRSIEMTLICSSVNSFHQLSNLAYERLPGMKAAREISFQPETKKYWKACNNPFLLLVCGTKPLLLTSPSGALENVGLLIAHSQRSHHG